MHIYVEYNHCAWIMRYSVLDFTFCYEQTYFEMYDYYQKD